MKKSTIGNEDIIAVVLPCYRVGWAVLDVIAKIGPEVHIIYVVDDCCPDGAGDLVEAACSDPRVEVLRHQQNQGVGGALVTGYRAALRAGAKVVVKLDGDGQMNPELLPRFIRPILSGQADYTKGNRFYRLESVRGMPPIRLFGNAVLSFMTKLSSGYWSIFDPTNGYTAIHGAVLSELPLEKIAKDYFFESDILFRLNTLRAVVQDIPMESVYGDEKSNMKIANIIPKFVVRHMVNIVKRVFYNYFLRDFQAVSVEILVGLPLVLFGVVFGVGAWHESIMASVPATSGTVMIASLPIIVGMQLLLSALVQDIQQQPTVPLQQFLPPMEVFGKKNEETARESDKIPTEVSA